MSWWGKVIGGTFGFMLGGYLGALLGAALGHQFDKGFRIALEDRGPNLGNTERVQAAFFTTTFTVMGHLAKSDGRVSEQEISLARHVMAQMQLSEEQKRTAIGLFNEGKAADFRLEAVLEQFRQECVRRTNLLQMFLEIMIATAMADGQLHDRERQLLYRICDGLHFNRHAFEQLLQMVQAQQHYAGAGAGDRPGPRPQASLDDAYAVLNIPKTATDAEVKKAYRRQMNQHHPDKLVAKGLPEEMINIAKEKSQEIRAAYDQIRAARGMR